MSRFPSAQTTTVNSVSSLFVSVTLCLPVGPRAVAGGLPAGAFCFWCKFVGPHREIRYHRGMLGKRATKALYALLALVVFVGAAVAFRVGTQESWIDRHRTDAERGDAYSQSVLAYVYARGEGVPKDMAEALKWRRKLAEVGTPWAQFNLGDMYRTGDGVPKDMAEALKWFRKAAEQGYAKAQSTLARMYVKGEGVPKDTAEGLKWLRPAAEQGDAEAQSNLGRMYFRGEGVPENTAEALKWLRLAEEQGNGEARSTLVLMYAEGRAEPKGPAEAMRWGEHIAFYLALGLGPDEGALAAKQYRLAAEQGRAEAQFKLGQMYVTGKSVPKDLIVAYVWFNLAAAQGHKTAGFRRDDIATRMTPEAIAEAQRQSREWRPTKVPTSTEGPAASPSR